MSEEEKNEDGFAKMIEATAALQKAMAVKMQPLVEQIIKQEKTMRAMSELFDSVQPLIDQYRKWAETTKALREWYERFGQEWPKE